MEGSFLTLALAVSRRKGRDALSQEREPSQRAIVPGANYRCHPSALGMQ